MIIAYIIVFHIDCGVSQRPKYILPLALKYYIWHFFVYLISDSKFQSVFWTENTYLIKRGG